MRTEASLDFIEQCAREPDIAILIDKFRLRIAEFGFSAGVCGAWTGIGKGRRHRFFFNFWPQDWLDIYMREGFFEDDPLVDEARRRMVPFLWREVEQQICLTARSRFIRDTAYRYGWREILGLPIHGPNGYQGLVSMAGMNDLDLTLADRSLINAMALAIHDRCRLSGEFGLEGAPLPDLTLREIESLRWAAIGKTDWEIGQLMNVTASTAHFHIEKAKKKLGVTSRVQAVALMTLRGLI